MAQLKTGTVTVIADGTTWNLRCDFNALCDYEEASGESAVALIEALERDEMPSVLKLRAFIWHCLKQCHPDADLMTAGRILSSDLDVLKRAFDLAFPDAEGGASEGISKPGEVRAAQG